MDLRKASAFSYLPGFCKPRDTGTRQTVLGDSCAEGNSCAERSFQSLRKKLREADLDLLPSNSALLQVLTHSNGQSQDSKGLWTTHSG